MGEGPRPRFAGICVRGRAEIRFAPARSGEERVTLLRNGNGETRRGRGGGERELSGRSTCRERNTAIPAILRRARRARRSDY